jgi:hypothetical protein
VITEQFHSLPTNCSRWWNLLIALHVQLENFHLRYLWAWNAGLCENMWKLSKLLGILDPDNLSEIHKIFSGRVLFLLTFKKRIGIRNTIENNLVPFRKRGLLWYTIYYQLYIQLPTNVKFHRFWSIVNFLVHQAVENPLHDGSMMDRQYCAWASEIRITSWYQLNRWFILYYPIINIGFQVRDFATMHSNQPNHPNHPDRRLAPEIRKIISHINMLNQLYT